MNDTTLVTWRQSKVIDSDRQHHGTIIFCFFKTLWKRIKIKIFFALQMIWCFFIVFFLNLNIYTQLKRKNNNMCGKSYMLCYTFITLTMYLLIFINQSHLQLNDTCHTCITMLIRVVHTQKYPKNKIIWQYHYISYFIIVS